MKISPIEPQMSEDDLVLYAINTKSLYVYMALRSLRGLRQFNRTIPVTVALYADQRPEFAAQFEALNAKVVLRNSDPMVAFEPLLLKWDALASCREPRILFLDADTIISGDVATLFDRYSGRDFWAREESGTEVGRGEYRLGNLVCTPQVDEAASAELFLRLGAKYTPIFNTGVMLFNRTGAQSLRDINSCMRELCYNFKRGLLPFPLNNMHLVEEYAAALAFGLRPSLAWGLIDPSDSPYFAESVSSSPPSLGTVMHVWTFFYHEYLKFSRDQRAASEFADLYALHTGTKIAA